MISYQVPEAQWTEKMVKNLPSEDDRFEFKEIIDIDKIAQEICAFANSFGGTLFLGIEDKNGQIKGIDKKKGNKPITLWLEQKIPVLLEFRFGSFRVREVNLTPSTQKKIGSDKTVVSIDVFDSDLTPYQVVQTRKYYRRENSSSIAAPHSFLSYLWSRNSSEKTNVVQYWITDFLTPLIHFTQNVSFQIKNLEFFGEFKNPGGSESFYILQFTNLEEFNKINNKLSANQFLRTYKNLEPKIKDLSESLQAFEDFIYDFIENILENENLQNVIREKYKTYISNQNPPWTYDQSEHPFKMLSNLLAIQDITSLSNNETYLKFYTSRFMVYDFFEFHLKFSTWKDEAFKNFCSDILEELIDCEYFIERKSMMEQIKNEIILKASSLFEDADTLREELCLRHNTTY